MKELIYKQRGVDKYHSPITYWEIDDNTIVAIYQGYRGDNPELDFIVKYKQKGKRLRTPSHTHWIVDLLLKTEYDKDLVLSYVENLISLYDNVTPFTNTKERNNYELRFGDIMNLRYQELNSKGSYTIKVLTTFIELFSMCEKQTKNAFMFKNLLNLIKEYCEGKKDFYQIVGYSKRV